MKKLLTFVFSIGLLFSMAACSSSKVEDKALDALEASINKIVEMKTASYSLTVDAKVGDENAKIYLHGGYLADTAKPSFTAVMDLESQETKMENFMGIYMKDNIMYINMEMMGMKQKTTMKEAENSGLMPEDIEDIQNFKMDKEEIKPYLKKASLEGNTLTLELDPAKLTEVVKDKGTTTGLTSSTADVTYSKFNLIVTLKDDFMTKAVIDFEGAQKNATTSEDETITGKMTLEFTDINTGKALEFPDFSDYIDSAETN